MKIAIGSDHAGYELKEKLKAVLAERGEEVQDFGTHSPERCDYPVFCRPVAEAVASGKADRGIVLGGSGNGEAMTANKVPEIRCALCWNEASARFARAHNDANVLAMGERLVSVHMACCIVAIFLETEFEGGRHVRRVRLIDHPEEA